MIWVIIKPLLKLISILNGLLTFYKIKHINSKFLSYKIRKSSPKIIAIGNLIVGGAGKTPSTICIVNKLLARGIKPAVISRGYKSEIDNKNKKAQFVRLESKNLASREFGDEPCLIAETGAPVCVGDRLDSFNKIDLELSDIDVILLDDGLQQTKIKPDKRILVIDNRLLGNGELFPYGPLREKPPLKYNVDGIILNLISDQIKQNLVFDKFQLEEKIPVGHLQTDSTTWKNILGKEFETKFIQKKIHDNYQKTKTKPLAIAGIAVPNRFFKVLEKLEIEFEPLWLANHDLGFAKNLLEYLNFSQRIVLMTEKDGVRIIYSESSLKMNTNQFWILKLNLSLEPTFIKNVTNWI